MTQVSKLKELRSTLYSMSIEEAQGELEVSALQSAVAAMGQIEQRAKASERQLQRTNEMAYEIKKTTVRGISELSDGDIKASLMSEMVNGKAIQIISPKHSASGEGEMAVWLEHA